MDMRVKLAVGTSLVAGVGISAALLLSKRGDDIREPSTIAETAAVEEVEIPKPTQAQKEFQSMAVESNAPECCIPHPPNALDPMALVRNSYAAILEILVMESWQETGSCDCPYNQITWEEVIRAAPEYERTDGIPLRFDFPKLRARADELVSLRSKACSG
jgi:hypothetical protein